MKKQAYKGQNINGRVAAVHDVWVEAALKEHKSEVFRMLTIRAAISFTVGFITAMLTPKWFVLPITLFTYVAFFFLWKAVLKKLKEWEIPAEN